MRSHTPDELHAQASMRADLLLAPSTAAALDPTAGAVMRARMLAEARRRHKPLPRGGGSHDGIADVIAHTRAVERHPLFHDGLVLADVEPISAARADEVALRVAAAVAAHVDGA